MNDTSLLGLIQNSALLLAVAFLFDVVVSRLRIRQSSLWKTLIGLVLGGIGIIVMQTPWKFGLGIVFDTRSVLLGISGLFFGAFSTVIAIAMTAAFRFYQGGTGAFTGIAVIITSGAIGIAWHHFRRHSLSEISWRELYFFGIVIHLAMLGLMFTLPWETSLRVLSNIALPALVIYPVGTALLGLLMVNRLQRERTEESLKESENKYRLLADNVNDVIFVLDMNLKYTYISPSVKNLREYEPEEVLKQQSIEQTLTPSSQALAMTTFSEIMELEKSGKREMPQSQILQLEMIRKDGTTVWTEVKLSFIRDENQQPVGIMGLTRDITERMQTERELYQTLDNLRKSFGATVQVMVSAVEMRDPYTAGHQLRVADLARTIATEMGLPQDKIEGIRMAGSIHDIGKLSIPAEILSRPTKLTNIEFSMIKEHPQSGYEMLKNVDSPWPLAQIVYQHHERMNGTGYPRNLKGNEILMEARIMAVADVVEAMASHRPYRAALGIEAALEEIEKNKGIIYDADVVDACLKLFREKGYQLK
ncbi:MAG: hypothetical protein CVU51_01110 [Deltaproteobacteria bacterium HGW-Deltaproteobacteria-1]|jgi:PAS domain S-box-containing protein|nr:MAG: hypothetical protein CVU51_01110 [Deltaproteobacteria bacterium HGW-Deltaproteobacteria-1]